MTSNITNRLISIESNMSNLQQTLTQALEDGLRNISKQLDKKSLTDVGFNHQYFLLPQSDNPDHRLVDDAHAEIMIDGIIELYLNYNDNKSLISRHLKEFTNILTCR